MLRILLLLLFLPTVAQARPWPGEFSRKTYHTFYVENQIVTSMPFSIRSFGFELGKPAHLSFIKGYVNVSLHPQNSVDPPRYTPAYLQCHIGNSFPYYDNWLYMVAVSANKVCE